MTTAFGRLWVRAPLWRRMWYATGAAVAVTVAFPPAWLGGYVPNPIRDRPVAAQATASQSPAEGTDPAPQASTADAGVPAAAPPITGVPVAGTFYSGRLLLGAQFVPLPPGRWVALAVKNVSVDPAGGPPTMSAFLALVLGGRIAAAAIISGSVAPDPRSAGFAAPLNLEIPSFYYRRVLSAVDHGALDLWLCGTTQPSRWNDPLSQAAAGVIRQQSLALADRFASVVFRLADTRNWVSADFMYPDPASTTDPVRPWTEVATLPDTSPLSHVEKVRRWGKQWHEIMRRGFAGILRPGDEAQIAPP
jgi:hypothetical protein